MNRQVSPPLSRNFWSPPGDRQVARRGEARWRSFAHNTTNSIAVPPQTAEPRRLLVYKCHAAATATIDTPTYLLHLAWSALLAIDMSLLLFWVSDGDDGKDRVSI